MVMILYTDYKFIVLDFYQLLSNVWRTWKILRSKVKLTLVCFRVYNCKNRAKGDNKDDDDDDDDDDDIKI